MSKEAMKLALWHEAMAKEPNRNQAKREKHEATAKFIREALAKQEQGEPVGDWVSDKEYWEAPKQEPDYKTLWKQMCERCDELDAKLAKQEQGEPVELKKGECWPEEVMRQWDYWRKEIANGHKGSAPRDWFEGLSELKLIDTTPQQRTWVGLTDEELENAWPFVFKPHELGNKAIYQAIEAKLKEKNT
jgi:hypothetical protein